MVSILGRTFTDGLKAGRNGTIAIYGDDLQILCPSGACYLKGTLCDGTPIHAPIYKSDNGQITLYNCPRSMAIEVGISLHPHNEGCHMTLPYRILQATPDCSGEPYYQRITVGMTGVDYDFSGPYRDIPSSTHAILLRKEVATQEEGSDEATIPVELTALHLKTMEPVDLGTPGWDGPHHLFVTLQSERGSLNSSDDPDPVQVSEGTMTINFATMTFDATVNVVYDIRKDAIDGPVIYTGSDTIQTSDTPWSESPAEGVVVIEDVNDVFFPGVSNESIFKIDFEGEILDIASGEILQ